jgi:hypothetical protein
VSAPFAFSDTPVGKVEREETGGVEKENERKRKKSQGQVKESERQ